MGNKRSIWLQNGINAICLQSTDVLQPILVMTSIISKV